MPVAGGIDGMEGFVRAAALPICRVMAALAVLPVFGPGAVAKLGRFGVGLALGGAVVAARGIDGLADPGSDVLRFTVVLAKEILFGLLLGWLAGLVFEAVRIAGGLVASEMGLNLANQVDPVSNVSQPLIAQLFQGLAYIVFFTSGGHGVVLGALVRSLDAVPAGSFSLRPELADAVLAFVASMMLAGLRIAGPVFLVLVIVTICVGLLAKVAPSLHILDASYPVRILAALLLLILFLPVMMRAFDSFLATAGVELHAFAVARA